MSERRPQQTQSPLALALIAAGAVTLCQHSGKIGVLQGVADGGVVVGERCPHCAGTGYARGDDQP